MAVESPLAFVGIGAERTVCRVEPDGTVREIADVDFRLG
jgi:hypothetical protein